MLPSSCTMSSSRSETAPALARRHLQRQLVPGQLAAVHVEDAEAGRTLAVGCGHRRVLARREAQRRGEGGVDLDGAALAIEGDADADRDQRQQRLELGDAIAQIAVGLGQPLLAGAADAGQLQHGADAGEELARAERLRQVVVRARLEALDAGLFTGPGRDEDDREPAQRRVGADGAQQRQAVQPRHHHVGEQQIGRLAANRLERRQAVADGLDTVGRREQAGDVVAHVRVVVGHHDPRSWRRLSPRRPTLCSTPGPASQRDASPTIAAAGEAGAPSVRGVAASRAVSAAARPAPASAGIETRNVEPCPGSLTTSTSPSCRRTSSRTSARPMPLPSTLRPPAPRTRWNRSKRCGSSAAAMPSAGVAHLQDRRAALAAQAHLDGAVQGELEGVGEEVEDDLLPHLAVDGDRLGERRTVDDEGQAGALDRRAEDAGDVGGQPCRARRARDAPAGGRPRCARSRAAC